MASATTLFRRWHHAEGPVEAMPAMRLETDAEAAAGAAALHFAAAKGHLDAVRFLLEVGVDRDQQEMEDRKTPLHHAAEGGYVDTV